MQFLGDLFLEGVAMIPQKNAKHSGSLNQFGGQQNNLKLCCSNSAAETPRVAVSMALWHHLGWMLARLISGHPCEKQNKTYHKLTPNQNQMVTHQN